MESMELWKLNECGFRDWKFLNEMNGAFCKKESTDGNVQQYAYISPSTLKLVILDDEKQFNLKVYDWNNKDEGESHRTIALFLTELAFRPLLLKGTPIEVKRGQEMWQLCIPQEDVPKSFIQYINKNIKL